jgi:hypothetical protein
MGNIFSPILYRAQCGVFLEHFGRFSKTFLVTLILSMAKESFYNVEPDRAPKLRTS